NSRVSSNLIVQHNFDEGSGNTIFDNVTGNDAVDLTIFIPSAVNWITSGLEVTNTSSISADGSTGKLYNSLMPAEQITVELWIKPASGAQNGPARIMTYSKNGLERNFGLFQNNDRFEFRLRTTETDQNGVPSLISDQGIVQEELTHIVYNYSDNDTARLFINGELITQRHIAGTFSNWDTTYSFGIANEFIDNKPWRGTFYLAAVYNRALSSAEIKHNFSQSIPSLKELSNPTNLQASLNISNSVELNWTDNADNELGFSITRERINSGSIEIVDSVANDINAYVDTTAVEGTNYEYYVNAYNDFAVSGPSNLAEIFTRIPAPSDLSGVIDNTNIQLTWVDNSKDESGFVIQGKPSHDDSLFTTIASVGVNTTSYLDTNSKYFSPYQYRVYASAQDTISDYSNIIIIDVVAVEKEIPKNLTAYSLDQNYPNPFNPETIIAYSLPEKSNITVSVYDILGRPIKKLVNTVQNKGSYEIHFNAENLSTGVYFYKMEAISLKSGQKFEQIKKLLLVK
ncbi:MAG: LamG-like jellyroll fold domain-containing protein, partial [Melioribacteraceae bacterium]|nr:LamG-like jellyroll fold domain-containing protein [Melioribacteraceae bacterium]